VNSAIEPILREWYFEDFEVGQVHTTMGRTLAEADVMTFVGFTGIFEQIFINAEYAREQTIFGRRVVPGLCILVVVEGLYVLTGHTHHGKAFLGLDELKIDTSVTCGDTIHAEVTVESVRPSSKHEGHGVMALRHRVFNQDGAEVMSYKTVRLMECRPA
jgi:acyl dehydratase